MLGQTSDEHLGEVLLRAIRDGEPPDDEQVVSTELSSSTIDSLSRLLERARAEVKDSIRELSRISAPDIDGWIAQAKQLRGDIVDSQREAQDITKEAEKIHELQLVVEDTAAKTKLLQGEVAFNEILTGTLQQIYDLRDTLTAAQDAVLADRLADSATLLARSHEQLRVIRDCDTTRLGGLLRAKIGDVRNTLAEKLTEAWNSLVGIDRAKSQVSIRHEIHRNSTINIDEVISALKQLDLLQGKIVAFGRAFDETIVAPCLNLGLKGSVGSLSRDGDIIYISERMLNSSIPSLFSDIRSIVEYLIEWLPPSISLSISAMLMSDLIAKLVSGPLTASVPSDLNDMKGLQTTLSDVLHLAEFLDRRGWQGAKDLKKWVDDAPITWLKKRSESALGDVRHLLLRGLGDPRTVERVKTEVIQDQDETIGEKGLDDDWNAGWSDEEGDGHKKPARKQDIKMTGRQEDVDDDDASAWGLADEVAQTKDGSVGGSKVEAEDTAHAWGWGDDNEDSNTGNTESRPPADSTSLSNGHPKSEPSTDRKITLKETYSVTALPEQILEIIIQIGSDVESLATADPSTNPVAPAAKHLLSLPDLVLSLFRATAPTMYDRDANGSIYLYNDSLYMAEQLRQHSSAHPFPRLDLRPSATTLSTFGKRAYSRAKESHRSIIRDLLDGAQGFANCTLHPFAQSCDLAVASVVDHLRAVHAQWRPVLSRSALLSALGSLLSTVARQLILDVEDMADISEPESQRLTAFCGQIAALEDLFGPEAGSSSTGDGEGRNGVDEAVVPLTAVYTPQWLKFRYLAMLLESSLVDIRFLWREGGLRAEFGTEEVVDLVRALFEDSEYRRGAVGEIRRG